MINITFREEKYKFKKGQFTDLDSWYSERYEEISKDYLTEDRIDIDKFDKLLIELDEKVDEIWNEMKKKGW